MADSGFLFPVGFILIIVGTVILALAVILLNARARKGKVKAAGVIVIGPVPIIFGTDKKSAETILILSIILLVLAIIAMVIVYFL